MSLPPLPLLLYAEPTWSLSPRKVCIYLQEKQLLSTFVKIVPHLDEEASKVYPKIVGKAATKFMGPTVPKLAVPKHTNPSNSQDEYTWLVESSAIIEYLEDLCDMHPELSPVPSLRHGDDLLRRAFMRAELVRAEAVSMTIGATLVLGSQMYNDITNTDSVHVPPARAVVKMADRVVLEKLEKLDELLGDIVDFEGLSQDVVGAATVADIVLFGTLAWFRDCYSIAVSKGYRNIERFMEAWNKRKTSKAGLADGGYPEMVLALRNSFKEEVWPRAVLN